MLVTYFLMHDMGGMLHYEDLWMLILEELSIRDLMTVGQMCHTMHDLCSGIARHHLCTVLYPWTAGDVDALLTLMEDGRCVVTGSCVWTMWCGGHNHNPQDLNLVMPSDSFGVVAHFIHQTLGYNLTDVPCHTAIAHVVGRFHRYVQNGRAITLSGPKEHQHPLHMILGAPLTTDMMVMTARGITIFYLAWMEAGLSLRSHSGKNVASGEKLGSVGGLVD